MNFIRLKMVVVLALITNVTMPMENQLWQNGTQLGVCDAFGNASMPMETQLLFNATQHGAMQEPYYANVLSTLQNYPGLFNLCTQVLVGITFKCIHCFFGTELIPVVSEKTLKAQIFTGLVEIWSHKLSNNMVSGGDVLPFLLILTGMVHTLNFMDQKWLKEPIPLTIKNKIDIATLDDAKCLICYEDTSDREYVNPCAQVDHIFCKKCLTERFNAQKRKPSFKNKISFFCDACVKEVLFNDEKFEIEPQATMGLKYAGTSEVILWYASVCTLSMMLCHYISYFFS